jgi:hypothetical protein
LPKATVILHEVGVVRRMVDDLQDDIRGKLTVGIIPTIMRQEHMKSSGERSSEGEEHCWHCQIELLAKGVDQQGYA